MSFGDTKHMTNEELKTALLTGKPIVYEYDGALIDYNCVSAIIYRAQGGKVVVSAEIQDKNSNSISIVRPEKLKFKTEE